MPVLLAAPEQFQERVGAQHTSDLFEARFDVSGMLDDYRLMQGYRILEVIWFTEEVRMQGLRRDIQSGGRSRLVRSGGVGVAWVALLDGHCVPIHRRLPPALLATPFKRFVKSLTGMVALRVTFEEATHMPACDIGRGAPEHLESLR